MLMRDFNIDVNTNVTPTRDYLHMLQSNACINLITKPTRVTSKTQAIIDHIVTNDSESGITPVFLITAFLIILVSTLKNLNLKLEILRDISFFEPFSN